MPEALSEDIINQLREQIQAELQDLKIESFQVKSDLDHDGDPILRFEIVYDETRGEPRTKLVSSLTRHLRPWLDTRIPNTFPVFRFMAARDYADEAH